MGTNALKHAHAHIHPSKYPKRTHKCVVCSRKSAVKKGSYYMSDSICPFLHLNTNYEKIRHQRRNNNKKSVSKTGETAFFWLFGSFSHLPTMGIFYLEIYYIVNKCSKYAYL